MARMPRSRPRWFRYSLRTSFVLLTAAGIALGFWFNRVHRQWMAVQYLRAHGAEPIYEDDSRGGAVPMRAPAWLVRWLGHDYCGRVVSVLINSKGTEETLKRLKDLPHLRAVSLGENITDAGLAEVANCRGLTYLHIVGSKFTDVGMRHIGRLHQLEALDISGELAPRKVGAEWWSKQKKLEASEHRTPLIPGGGFSDRVADNITDVGMAQLGGLTKLRNLRILSSRLTDAGTKCLANMPYLHALNLNGSKVGDGTLHALRYLTGPGGELRSLELEETRVTDEGLRHLEGISTIDTLTLRYTEVTEAGLRAFRRSPLRNVGVDHTRLKSLDFLQSPQPADRDALIYLYIFNTPLDDAGLAAMPMLPRVGDLNLSGTRVTSKGLAGLGAKLPQCSMLVLQGTQVDDEGIAKLISMPKLWSLQLEGTKVTNKALGYLEQMHLDTCTTGGTAITDAAIAEFKKRHPDTKFNAEAWQRWLR